MCCCMVCLCFVNVFVCMFLLIRLCDVFAIYCVLSYGLYLVLCCVRVGLNVFVSFRCVFVVFFVLCLLCVVVCVVCCVLCVGV